MYRSLCSALLAALCATSPLVAGDGEATLRVSQFNVWELSREKLDRVDAAGRGTDPQLVNATRILRRVRPDVLLINEIDVDPEGQNAELFVERYLAVGSGEGEPLDYPHVFMAPVNTGVPSGLDFDDDGKADGPADAYGFGRYPGQYGMALLSRFPIDDEGARTLRLLLWKDMPGSVMPDGKGGRPAYYSEEEVAAFRLSSKSHWDIPVVFGALRFHVLAAHPTPPVFDGPEDANGRRNFDEIRLLADYARGGETAAYIVDDAGRSGGLAADTPFVVMGDMNADPEPEETPYGRPPIALLLGHPRLQDPRPASDGGAQAPARRPSSLPQLRTSDWGRLDYVLPSTEWRVLDSAVFWPAPGEPGHEWVEGPARASDHHLVWVDLLLN